jgi:uncharacterized membrane protein
VFRSPLVVRPAAPALILLLLVAWACGGDDPGHGGQGEGFMGAEMEEPRAYRGILAMGLEERGFIPCGEEIPAWVEDATGGELQDLYGMLAAIPNEPVYAELVGVIGDPPTSGPGARYAYGFRVSEIRQLSFAGEAMECPEPEWGLVARGNEPDWAVRFGVDGVEMQAPDLLEPIRFPPASERMDGDLRILTTTHEDGRVLELVVQVEPCLDSMSGERFPFLATRRWQGASHPGCGWGEG